MFFTARQLEDLHRANGSNGHLVLPYRARLSPLASDWVKSKKIVLGYSEDGRPSNGSAPPPAAASSDAPSEAKPGEKLPAAATIPAGSILWWCDGPCGPSKAAVVGMEREAPLRPMQLPQDRRFLVPVVREIAGEISGGRASAAVVIVQNAATVMVYANRCPSLRAVVGTCLEAVEQGIREVAANVLVIEHPYKTMQQVRGLLQRFAKANRSLSEEVKKQLKDLASCG